MSTNAKAFFVLLFLFFGLMAGNAFYQETRAQLGANPAKLETLSCVRAKEVTPAGTINYLCEVRK